MAKYGNKRKGRYKSILESNIADYLTNNNIPFEYEPIKFVLQEKIDYPTWEKNSKNEFSLITKKKEISYTPDFIGKGWIIEGKGLRTQDFNNKWKLFQKYLIEHDLSYKLFLIQRLKDLPVFKSVINNEEIQHKRSGDSIQESSRHTKRRDRKEKTGKRLPRVRKVLHG